MDYDYIGDQIVKIDDVWWFVDDKGNKIRKLTDEEIAVWIQGNGEI